MTEYSSAGSSSRAPAEYSVHIFASSSPPLMSDVEEKLIEKRKWLQTTLHRMMVQHRWSINDLCILLVSHIYYGEWPRGSHDKIPFSSLQRWITQRNYTVSCYLEPVVERFIKSQDQLQTPSDSPWRNKLPEDGEADTPSYDSSDSGHRSTFDSDCCMTEIEDNSCQMSELFDSPRPLDVLVRVAGEERNKWLQCSADYEKMNGQIFEELVTKIA